MALSRIHSYVAPVLHHILAAVVERRSGRHDSHPHEAVAGSRPLVGLDELVEDHSDHRVDRRSSRAAAVEYGGGSHHGEGCSHVVDHDDRSSHLVVDRRVRGPLLLDSLASVNDSAHVDEGSRFAADMC